MIIACTSAGGYDFVIDNVTDNPRFTFTGDGGSDIDTACPLLVSSFDCSTPPGNDRFPLRLTKATIVDSGSVPAGRYDFYCSIRWFASQDNGTLSDLICYPGGQKIPLPQKGTYRNVGTWVPDLMYTGCYSVYAYIPWNSTANARYMISDVTGTHDSVQKQYKGDDRCAHVNDWVDLRPSNPFHFNTGEDGSVSLSDETTDPEGLMTCVAFDGMKFELVKEAEIDIRLFLDRNNNGIREDDEPLSVNRDATVTLFSGGCDSTSIDSAVTVNGEWHYVDGAKLRFGTNYYAKAAGSDRCGGPVQLSTAAADNCTTGPNVPICNGSLTICKYDDQNLNGVKDAGEGLLEWPFSIAGPNSYSSSVATGVDGCVTVTGLEEGTYIVTELVPEPDQNGNFTFRDRRWHAFTPLTQTKTVTCSTDTGFPFRNVALGSVSACKFNDCDMDGIKQESERAIVGWPVRIVGTDATGDSVGPIDSVTDSNGCCKFDELFPGTYYLSEEGNGIAWEKVQTTCGATSYCDWRTTWDGKRWQSTKPRPSDNCADAGGAPKLGPLAISGNDLMDGFGNVQLGTVSASVFHDLNMNGTYEPSGELYVDKGLDDEWTPGEQFTDLNCNGRWDQDEFFVDWNKNGIRDAGDPFTDSDTDGAYDYPECTVADWPFALFGTRRDGRTICPKAKTDTTGTIIFTDIPPAAVDYSLSEDCPWTQVALPTETVNRTSQTGTLNCGCASNGIISRWEATTPIQVQFPLDCGASYSSTFANVCLTTVDGVKEIYLNGMPGQSSKEADASGWSICLAGKDAKGRDVVPSLSIDPTGGPSVLVSDASKAPIATPCLNPKWYELRTATDGSFHFLDLPPGHYHLTEQPDHPGLRLDMDKPMMSGFDVRCCPVNTVMRNIADVPWNIYQAYCGSSCGDTEAVQQINGGFRGGLGDPITAVPGVFAFDSGPGWQNYVRATELCREAKITNVSLRKYFEGNDDCPDYFKPVNMLQQGSTRVRNWWPLMYEPPTTSWTLSVYYDTATPVQFPGETQASVHHQDSWQWTVVTDIEHTKLFIDMIHELPLGTTQKPVLSDEKLYKQLKAQLDEIDDLAKQNKLDEAGMKLDTFILDVEDACITESCLPFKFGAGIANTAENPACCKLLLDADYIGKTLNLWRP